MNFLLDQQHKPPKNNFLPGRLPINSLPLSAGQTLDPAIRLEMEQQFNHDFSQVRIHSDALADQASRSVAAHAYTTGQDIVFREGYYRPYDRAGKQLLAHELAHVVQQSNTTGQQLVTNPEQEAHQAAQQIAHGEAVAIQNRVPAGALQCEDDEEERRFRLRMPELGESLPYRSQPLHLLDPEQYQLRLDPQIQAQIEAIRFAQAQLSLDNLEAAVSQIGTTVSTPTQAPPNLNLSPSSTARAATAGTPGANVFSAPSVAQPQPLVPAGRGPATPRAGEISDILEAVLQIPAVQQGVTRLQEQAGATIRRDWSRLSGGERALLITQGILMGAGALTAVGLNSEARQFVLDQIQNRDLPIPGLPVTFRFNATGPNQQLIIGVDLMQLIPESLR